ncbi:DUF1573 domain-containing protein [Belliella marina]|uniref:DUF1573 domain-containing protein n=1 Tax=Belliella marina TaxID=1644146 RepID=A0ABW4VQM5_9BACT
MNSLRCLVLLINCLILFGCEEKSVSSEIWTPSKILQIGEFSIADGASDSILLVNKGNSKVRIKNYQSDCACTIPKLSKDWLNPSDSVFLKFDLHPSLPGVVQQKIIVETNSSSNPKFIFLIRGKAIL